MTREQQIEKVDAELLAGMRAMESRRTLAERIVDALSQPVVERQVTDEICETSTARKSPTAPTDSDGFRKTIDRTARAWVEHNDPGRWDHLTFEAQEDLRASARAALEAALGTSQETT